MILTGKEAKEKLLTGINKNADIVKTTLGAKGKNVMIIDKLRMINKVTKDGVSISKRISLDDPIEDAGSQLIQESADKTVIEAGDGTTTTTILTQSMCNSINTQINFGKDANQLCADLKDDLKTIKNFIAKKSEQIKNTTQIRNIAMVSSNNDIEVATIIEKIYDEIGFQGAIDVREGDSLTTNATIVNGFTLPNTGYINHSFINNFEKNRVEFVNPKILIYNGKINHISEEFLQLINNNSASNENLQPLVIILQDIEETILDSILMSVSRNALKNVAIVQSNLIYKNRENRFKDASKFINAEYCENKIGNLGSCEKIIIEKDSTTFINGAGDTKNYLKELKKELKNQKDIELEKRIFSLENKAAIITVGGKLQTEISEKKDRIDDAVLAVKSAIEEGFCAGGSSTFIFAYKNLKFKTDIMKEAMISCYKQLLKNANREPYYIMKNILDEDKYGFSYNVNTDKIENMLDSGIIDSSKVLRVSLENSVHTACTFAMIESIIE